MLKIPQGSNTPIHLRFKENPAGFTYLTAGLYNDGFYGDENALKTWAKSDMTINSNEVYLPLTQAETAALDAGEIGLLIKYRTGTSPVVIVDRVRVEVIARGDRGVLLGGN